MRAAWVPGLIAVAVGVVLAILSLPMPRDAVPLAPPLRVEGVSFRAVPACVRSQDVAQLLQARLETDGSLGLRIVTCQWPCRAGAVLGSWRFSGVPEVDRQVLHALRKALGEAIFGPEEGVAGAAPSRAWDKIPRSRLVIDAAPEVAWERTSWVVSAATHHDLWIRRFTFLGQGAGVCCDLEVPQALSRDRSHDAAARARRVVVRLFRKGLDAPAGRQFTRIRSSADSLEVRIDPDGFPYEVEGHDVVSPDPSMTIFDLQPSSFVRSDHPTAWEGLETLLAERGPDPLRYAEVTTSRPIGTQVPTGDVVEVMLRLQRAGYAPIFIDNPAPPGAPVDPPEIEDVGR